jgi:hypothetical protein
LAKDAKTAQRTLLHLAELPLSFEPNRGQAAGDVKFVSRGSAYTLALSSTSALLHLQPSNEQVLPATVQIQLLGARQTEPAGRDAQAGRSNYFVGSDPKAWIRDVPQYGKVEYSNVYPGIDMVYYGNQRSLEYDMVVAPGADPSQIRLKFQGQKSLRVDKAGDLILSAGGGSIRQRKPVLYQNQNGAKTSVKGRYVLLSRDEVGFEVPSYDTSAPLVIDPVLLYSTYLGGASSDFANDIAVDSTGALYLTGGTDSTLFPVAGPFRGASAGGRDAFVTKINPAGNALVFSTYLGGAGADWGFGIAVDSGENVYLTGSTNSSDFPTSAPKQAANGGGWDGFVAKLNNTGSGLIFSTYLGGSGDDYAFGIAVDNSQSVYVTGQTSSANFPVASALQSTFGGLSDAFVAKYNAAGSQLTYSTYLGGSGADTGERIAVDSSGNALVAGATSSLNFPTASPLQAANAGGVDGFVAKLNGAGSALTYSTYLGGTGTDWATDIGLDSAGTAYVTGFTLSTNFPTVAPLQAANAGGADAFVSHLNAAGSALVYSTYLGGPQNDYGYGIAVDTGGNAYLTGATSGTLPIPAGALQSTPGGARDSYLMKLNAAGSAVVLGTYLGGTSDDEGNAVALDNSGNVYLGGITSSNNFPTASPLQAANHGPFDAYAAKIATLPTLTVSSNSLSFNYKQGTTPPASQQFTVGAAGGSLGYTVSVTSPPAWLSFSPNSGTAPAPVTVSVNPSGLAPNTYSATLTVASPGQTSQLVTVTLNVAASALNTFPDSLLFTAEAGSGVSPSDQFLQVYETSGASVNFTASASVTSPSGGSWLSVSPTTGTTYAFLSITATLGTLPAGTYSGTIHITAPDVNPVDVPVTFTVTSAATFIPPDSLFFSHSVGSSDPLPLQQDFFVYTTGDALDAGVSTSVFTPISGTWLTASPSGITPSASSPADVTVSVDPTGLPAGDYQGSVNIQSGEQSTSAPVFLSVGDPVFCLGSACEPFTNPMVFTSAPGGAPQSNINSLFDNFSFGTYNYTATAVASEPKGGTWLSISPASGTTNSNFTITVTPGALGVGTYHGIVTINPTGATSFDVPVTLIISLPVVTPPTLTLSPLNPFVSNFGGVPATQQLSITSDSTPAPYTAAAVTTTGGTWLSLSALSGSTNGTPLTVTANPAGLGAGTYNGTITVTAPSLSNSPQTVAVSLTVNPAPSLTVSTTPLIFTWATGSPLPPDQTVAVGGNGTPLTYRAAAAVLSGPTWLHATLRGISPGQLVVHVDPRVVTPGTYTGNITITAQGEPGSVSHVIPVTLTIAGGLVITPATLPAATGLRPYDVKLSVSGGATPYFWSQTGLPAGLSINSATGEISGTPIAFGTFPVIVSVRDSGGVTGSMPYNLSVSSPSAPPVITTNAVLPDGFVNVSYNVAFAASGGNGGASFGQPSGTLPPGLDLDSSGVLKGLPTTAGTYHFSISVSDVDGLSSTANFTLTIRPQPLAIITSSPLPQVVVGGTVNVKFTAFGGVQPYSFTGSSLPPGTSLATDGTLSGTATTPGTFPFTVTVSDKGGSTPSTKSFSLTVVPAALTIAASFGNGQQGVAYQATVSATGGVGPYTFAVSGLPDGVTFLNGTASGSPTGSGKFTVTVTVTDSAKTTVSQSFTITIAPPTLTVTTSTLPNGTVGVAYSATLAASGGTGAYTWSVSGLPANVSATAAGVISGTPSAPGPFTVSATVTDASGATASKAYSITVAPAPLAVTTSSLTNATAGASYTLTLAASGGVGPYTWTASGLPSPLTISSAGVITGTPSAPGSSSVTVTVKDSTGVSVSQTFTLTTVLPVTPTVTVTGLPATAAPATQSTVTVGLGTTYPVPVTVNLVLTFAADSGPDDPTVQFATGARTASLTIPAGSTSASTGVGVQTGTVAGTATITVQLLAGTQNITPSPAPTRTVRINPVPPVVSSVTATASGTGFTVTVVGYATSRSMTQAVFTFTPAAGVNLQTTSVTVPVSTLFAAWYASTAATPFGGQFTFTQPFTLSSAAQISSVTVTMVNGDGSSTAVTATVH